MALYDEPVPLLLREMVEDLPVAKGDILSKQRVLAWFAQHYPKVVTTQLSTTG